MTPDWDNYSFITVHKIQGNWSHNQQKSDHHPFSWNIGEKLVC